MRKPTFNYKLHWLISALLLVMLIFLGYNGVNYSDNSICLPIPSQIENPDSNLPDYLPPDSPIYSQEHSEGPTFPNREIEIKEMALDTSLSYQLQYSDNHIDLDDNAADYVKESVKKSSRVSDKQTIKSTVYKTTSLFEKDIFWINYGTDIHLGQNRNIPTDGLVSNQSNKKRVDYTDIGSANSFEQNEINSKYNSQRITQVGTNNSTSQTLINTFDSELKVRSIGNLNRTSQNIYRTNNAAIVAIQNGFDNRARQEVRSANVLGTFEETVNEIRQNGYNNLFRTRQSGVSNVIRGIQDGNLNTVNMNQGASNSSIIFRQSGSGNSVTVKQY